MEYYDVVTVLALVLCLMSCIIIIFIIVRVYETQNPQNLGCM